MIIWAANVGYHDGFIDGLIMAGETPATCMLRTLRHILEMIRFSHTVFALPFALLAAIMAWTTPSTTMWAISKPEFGGASREIKEWPEFQFQHVAGILICMVAARSAAMAFNRLVDRDIDAENPRTKTRHLPAGMLSVSSVVLFTVLSSLAFIAGTYLFIPNRLPVILSLPVLLFLLGYSFTKRFTALAHFWLGAALMLAPICVWIAIRGETVLSDPIDILPAVILGGAVLTWVTGFDIIYACQDVEFDRQAKLKSIPAKLGVHAALRLAAVCHLVTVLLLAALPMVCHQVPLGWIYGLGVAAIAVLLAYEHSIVRPNDLTRVNVAFFNINAIISLGLLVVAAIDLLT
jgi:4-hydroxybenzoate polyprenyltransferase